LDFEGNQGLQIVTWEIILDKGFVQGVLWDLGRGFVQKRSHGY